MYYESQIWDKTTCINLSLGQQGIAKQTVKIYHHLFKIHYGSRNRIKAKALI